MRDLSRPVFSVEKLWPYIALARITWAMKIIIPKLYIILYCIYLYSSWKYGFRFIVQVLVCFASTCQ
jgi:hypothetical protein